MKREDITALFPDATKEQLDSLMAINGADIQKAKSGLEDLQNKLSEANTELETLRQGATELERLKGVETELNTLKSANALREMREKVSAATGVPAKFLTGDTEEDCTAWANSLKEYTKSSANLQIPNGGEPSGASGLSTAEQFAAWSENLF
jgi:DNA repair ATPase RecN